VGWRGAGFEPGDYLYCVVLAAVIWKGDRKVKEKGRKRTVEGQIKKRRVNICQDKIINKYLEE
jgi:hypothetical protein